MAPPSKDAEKDWEPIINAVRPHEFLYNPQLPDYMDRDKKKAKWAEIGRQLVPECDGDAAYLQWKRVKDMYDKKKREAAKKKSGSAADEYLKKWAWADQMSFLDKVRVVAVPCTNLPPPAHPSGSGLQSNGASDDSQSQNISVADRNVTALSQFPPSPAVGKKRPRIDDSVQDLAKKVLLNLNAKLEQCGPKSAKNAFAELLVARLEELEQITNGGFREHAQGRLLHVLSQIKAEAISGQHGIFSGEQQQPRADHVPGSQVQVLLPTQQSDTVTNFIPDGPAKNIPVYKQTPALASTSVHPFSPDSTGEDGELEFSESATASILRLY